MIWKLLSSCIQSFQLVGLKFWHVSFRGTKQVFEYELFVSVTINFLSSWMINFVCSTTNLNPLLKNFECRKGRTTPRVGLHFIRRFVFLSVVVPPSSLVLTVSLEFMSVFVVVLMDFWGNSCPPVSLPFDDCSILYIRLFHLTAVSTVFGTHIFFCALFFTPNSCDSGIFVMKLMQSHNGDKQHLFKPVSTGFGTHIFF